MRFETSQSMKLGQHMKLAPRMIQSMEILQMPLAELEERIELELSSNPTLELDEREIDEAALREIRDEAARDAQELRGELSHDERSVDDFARLESYEATNPDAVDNAIDDDRAYSRDTAGPEPTYEPGISRVSSRLDGEPDAKMQAMAAAPARSASLGEQLLRQWAVVDVDEQLRPLGDAIIGFLDDDGYLRVGLDEVAERSPRPENAGDDWPGDPDRWAMALTAVQLFLEPSGVAARDARECLLLQLDAALAGDLRMDGEGTEGLGRDRGEAIADAPTLANARLLVADHLDELMRNRLPKVSDRSGLSLDQIKGALEALRRFSLAPARRLITVSEAPITPDVIVEYDESLDRYIAYLNDTRLPNLRVNREYALLSRDRAAPKRDRDFLKKHLSNAHWLIDAVEQRRNTLLRVVQVVIEEQRDYFDYGPESLKPLPMTQVAEQIGVHVATVSRAVSDKWLQTPRGMAALRGFFSGGLSTEGGDDMSYDAVRAALREVVDQEDKRKPLSDDALAAALRERGIEIARRTVAKYRAMMDIQPARLRREF